MSTTPFPNEDNGPWYRQFWAWFVLAPVILIMFVVSVLIYFAITTADGPIIDNLYRDGRSYVERKDEDQWAAANNLSAEFQTRGSQIQLRLSGNFVDQPARLKLLFAFRTQASRDVLVELNRAPDGRYIGTLPEPISGDRQLLLEPLGEEQHWRLHGNITLPTGQITLLQPSE